MRRRNVPCSPCGDGSGCQSGCCGLKEKLAILWDRTIGSILKINNITPDGDGKFTVKGKYFTTINNDTNGIEVSTPIYNTDNNLEINSGLKTIDLAEDVTIADQLTVDGDAVFNGDIIQNGASYETHAQKVYTTDDYIITRDGAVGALAVGDYSGFQVKKYDGTNDGRLVMDRDGVARVGDVNDEQPLATRDESADMVDGELVQWDGTNQKIITSGKTVADMAGMELVSEHDVYYDMTGYEGTEVTKQITPGSGFKFETGYDYFIFFNTNPSANVNVYTTPNGTIGVNDQSFYIKIQASSSSFYTTYTIYRMKTDNPLAGSLLRFNTTGSASTTDQPMLVSGTNIKTINNTSLLGSGDITIGGGGLSWTTRTPNTDWSDMFEVVGGNLNAKKNVYIHVHSSSVYGFIFIPKGLTIPSPGKFLLYHPGSSYTSGSSIVVTLSGIISIGSTAISSGASTIRIDCDTLFFDFSGGTLTVSPGSNGYNISKNNDMTIMVAD